MELNDLLLKKEELPILHETCFQIPIHPKLLDETISINPKIAKNVFPQVVEEWKNEIKTDFPSYWEDKYQTNENGFVTNFSINRNQGGGIYFLEEDFNCQTFGNAYIKFSEKKKKEFEFEKNKIHCYASENIDQYDGALFLRNWAIKYMNEVFKEIF